MGLLDNKIPMLSKVSVTKSLKKNYISLDHTSTKYHNTEDVNQSSPINQISLTSDGIGKKERDDILSNYFSAEKRLAV